MKLPVLAALAALAISSSASPIYRSLYKRQTPDAAESKVGIVLPTGSADTPMQTEVPGTDAPFDVADAINKLGATTAAAVPTNGADVPFPAWVTDPSAPLPTFNDATAVTVPADLPTGVVDEDGDMAVAVPTGMPTAFPDAGGADADGEGASLPDGWGAIGGVEVEAPMPGTQMTVPADIVGAIKTATATSAEDEMEPTAAPTADAAEVTEGADMAEETEAPESDESDVVEQLEGSETTNVPTATEPVTEEPAETDVSEFESEQDVHDALLDALDSDVARTLLPEIAKLLKGSGAVLV